MAQLGLSTKKVLVALGAASAMTFGAFRFQPEADSISVVAAVSAQKAPGSQQAPKPPSQDIGKKVEGLEKRMDTGKPGERYEAMKELRSLAEENPRSPEVAAAVPSLIRRLVERQWNYGRHSVKAASDALVAIGEPSIAHLAKALLDKGGDEALRSNAALALGTAIERNPEQKDEAISALVEALADGHVRSSAMKALVKAGRHALPALGRALKYAGPEIRAHAATVLGAIGEKSSIPALKGALGDEDASVKSNALEALGWIRDAVEISNIIYIAKGTILITQEPDERKKAALKLGKMAKRNPGKTVAAVPYFIEALEDAEPAIQQAAFTALTDMGELAVAGLTSAMDSDSAQIRRDAISALGYIGGPGVAPIVIRALGDPVSDVRWAAASALGELQDARGIPPLLKALKDREEFVQHKAAEALHRFINEGLGFNGDAVLDSKTLEQLKIFQAAYPMKRIRRNIFITNDKL